MTAEATNKLTDYAITEFDKLLQAASAALPKATDAVLWTVRLDGIQDLILARVFGGLAVSAGLIARWLLKKGKAADRYEKDPWYIAGFLVSCAAALCCVVSIVILADVWTWTSIFRPDLYLVHAAITKITK